MSESVADSFNAIPVRIQDERAVIVSVISRAARRREIVLGMVIHELRPAKAPRSSSDSKIPTSTPSTHGAVNTPDLRRSGSSCASVSRRPDRAKNRPSARDAQDGRRIIWVAFAYGSA
jgi:hypothetical protein